MATDWKAMRWDGGRMCLDFANTVSDRTVERSRDYLADFEDLRGWLAHAGAVPTAVLAKDDSAPAARARLLAEALHLRELIYRVFSTLAAGRPAASVDLATLNELLAQALPYRRIAARQDDGYVWEWKWDSAAGRQRRLLWPLLWSAAETLTSDPPDRIRECPNCGWLFFDHSKNRSRAWCSMATCGSLVKARRYYRRKTGKENP
jgi:predicted RNA-binding Zn ribbon-like protein